MFQKKLFKKIALSALLAAVAGGICSQSFAEPTVSLSKWLEDVKVGGDLRIRYEHFHKSSPSQVNRTRERFRLRINTDFNLPNNIFAKLTFASGTGEQGSTNQSFDNLSSQNSIWIDKAYGGWKPFDFLTVQAGRMENPIWRQYSSDVVWDGDFNPQGFSQGVTMLAGPVNLFFNALQMVADEDSGNNTVEGVTTSTTTVNTELGKSHDQWMLGEQIGVEFKLPAEMRLRAAYANYNWINERYGSFGQSAFNEGNRRTSTNSALTNSNILINNFNINEYTGVLSGWLGHTPVQLQGTYVKNSAARKDLLPKEDTGYQWGTIVGKAKEAKSWEIAYFNKQVRTDATVADVSDSDFGDGGTNRKGHILRPLSHHCHIGQIASKLTGGLK